MNEKDKPRPQTENEISAAKHENSKPREDKQEGRMANGETGGATADIHEQKERSEENSSNDIY